MVCCSRLSSSRRRRRFMPRSALRPSASRRLRTCRPTRPTIKTPLPELPQVVSAHEPEDRDYLIRTIAFEAGEESDEGKAAVAHVILNRERSGRWGDSIRKVVTRPWQFEPWMTKRKQMVALSPERSPLSRCGAHCRRCICPGQIPDPTAGATHFLNPGGGAETAGRRSAGIGRAARGSRSAGTPSMRRTAVFPSVELNRDARR